MANGAGSKSGQRQTKEDALSLVRRLPMTLATSMQMRKRTKMPIQKPFKSCWVELRGSTLLFYYLPEGSSLVLGGSSAASTSPKGSNKAPVNPESLSYIRTPRGSKTNSLLTDDNFKTGKVKPDDITLIALKEVIIKANTRKGIILLKSSTDDEIGTLELKLRDPVDCEKWFQGMNSSKSLRSVGLSDFEIVKTLGKGASGKVFLVKDKLTGEELALKVIEKSIVYETNDAYRHALDERLVLELACEHPFILNLYYAFQSDKRLYLVTEYCAGHDLFDYLKARGRPLPEKRAKRVAAEILLALEHVHSLGVIYRDLKLENVLLDSEGHVRVADFGLSKIVSAAEGEKPVDQTNLKVQGAKTFCGTREYVAPEMLVGRQYGQSVDLWALGILIYEILCGRTPFYASNRDEVYDRIESAPLKFPRHLSSDVVSLIRGLLDRNPKTRLGMGPSGMSEVKSHPFFSDVDWTGLYEKVPHPDNLVMNPEDVDPAELEPPPGEEEDDFGFWLEDEREFETVSVNSKKDVWGMFASNKSQKSKKSLGIAGYEFSGNSPGEGRSRSISRGPSQHTMSRGNSQKNSAEDGKKFRTIPTNKSTKSAAGNGSVSKKSMDQITDEYSQTSLK
eukprot:CAMPEP_0184706422 /NCGR_PEP_ID=MMETSP0313-20130426/36752_1 /TAXON_ID=2792 /ORGANISM="Porphyridium aerugineum, Strain SAG 1380-2" /LENGTH=619 /DNA_ID=CAMNT_0027167975 /DNA_START=553 /DNA_END=2412 /DNA_ORIENTATION=+